MIHNFIVRYWEKVAAYGYEKCLTQGKGMVTYTWGIPVTGKNTFNYLPHLQLALAGYKPHLLDLVRQYDKNERIVFGVLSDVTVDAKNVFYLLVNVAGKSSPAIVYQQQREK